MYIFDISTINIHKPTSSSYTKPALLTKKNVKGSGHVWMTMPESRGDTILDPKERRDLDPRDPRTPGDENHHGYQ